MNGSQVQLVSNAQVIGGTLASPGSEIHNSGSNSLTNVTNNGALVLKASTDNLFILAGSVTNATFNVFVLTLNASGAAACEIGSSRAPGGCQQTAGDVNI